jgi:HEAT repeat protein
MTDARAGADLERARALLRDAVETERLRGVHVLRDEVTDRDAAARELVETLRDPGSFVPHAARAALQDLGDRALPALLDGLAQDDPVVRAGCAWALARPQPQDVTGDLARHADDAATSVREAVAGALGRVDGAIAERERVLVHLAEDAEPRVRTQAVESLGLLADLTDHGRRALADAVEDGRPAVRIAATAALARLTPDEGLIARVSRALDEEPTEQVAAPLRALLERWRDTP